MDLRTAQHDPRLRFAAFGLTVALLVAGVIVRGIPAQVPVAPDEAGVEPLRIAEPLQLLQSGADLRAGELDALVPEEDRVTFRAQRRVIFALEGCPALSEHLASEGGQRLERTLGELRRGTNEEALCALVFIFHLARATRWEPGWRSTADAERLGGLLQDWLGRWGQRAAEEPLLYEPSLAAVLLYGRCMRAAVEAPVMGRNAAPRERARNFLRELCGTGTRRRTAFGKALAARWPRAIELLSEDSDFLLGFEEEARVQLPDLEGTCARK